MGHEVRRQSWPRVPRSPGPPTGAAPGPRGRGGRKGTLAGRAGAGITPPPRPGVIIWAPPPPGTERSPVAAASLPPPSGLSDAAPSELGRGLPRGPKGGCRTGKEDRRGVGTGQRGVRVGVTCGIFPPGCSTLLNTEKGVWLGLYKRVDKGPRTRC